MEWNDQIIDDALRKSASSRNNSYPDDLPPSFVLWKTIQAKRKRRRVIRLQQLGAIAATLVLVVTAIVLWPASQKEIPSPVVHQNSLPEQMPAAENEAIAYIKRRCKGNNVVCHSTPFKELQSELDSSLTDLAAINQQIRLFGDDEQLLRAKTRIENHQARIVKAMLQIL